MKPPRFKYIVHIADSFEPPLNIQRCRRCQMAVLAAQRYWKDGEFVLETLEFKTDHEGVGYRRYSLSPVNEAEVLVNDKYEFCLSSAEQINEVNWILEQTRPDKVIKKRKNGE